VEKPRPRSPCAGRSDSPRPSRRSARRPASLRREPASKPAPRPGGSGDHAERPRASCRAPRPANVAAAGAQLGFPIRSPPVRRRAFYQPPRSPPGPIRSALDGRPDRCHESFAAAKRPRRSSVDPFPDALSRVAARSRVERATDPCRSNAEVEVRLGPPPPPQEKTRDGADRRARPHSRRSQEPLPSRGGGQMRLAGEGPAARREPFVDVRFVTGSPTLPIVAL